MWLSYSFPTFQFLWLPNRHEMSISSVCPSWSLFFNVYPSGNVCDCHIVFLLFNFSGYSIVMKCQFLVFVHHESLFFKFYPSGNVCDCHIVFILFTFSGYTIPLKCLFLVFIHHEIGDCHIVFLLFIFSCYSILFFL